MTPHFPSYTIPVKLFYVYHKMWCPLQKMSDLAYIFCLESSGRAHLIFFHSSIMKTKKHRLKNIFSDSALIYTLNRNNITSPSRTT